MLAFRSVIPIRSDVVKLVGHHSAHREDLRSDFKERCGYCNDWDYYKKTYYEIDHFIPEFVLKTISNTDYRNLVYACRSCNNSKRAKWPSGDEKIAIVNDQGFVDPCDTQYDTHFERDDVGNIVALTNVGKWMYVALKLSKPQHQLIYQLEKLDETIEQLEVIANQDLEVEALLTDLLKKYRRYSRELREV